MRRPILRSAMQILLALAFATGCSDAYPGANLESPDRRYVATFYGRGGGGAAGWSEQYLSVRKSDSEFAHVEANVVRALSQTYELCVERTGPTRLRVVRPTPTSYEELPYRAKAFPEVDVEFVSELSNDGMLREPCAGRLMELGQPNSR